MMQHFGRDGIVMIDDKARWGESQGGIGAYGYSMASSYNARLRPAEVLLTEGGKLRLIRRRDGYEDLLRNQVL